jgi:predicted transcriptional regulator
MAATSLKLPEGLKRRIERLAGAANKTAHAFMVEALSQEACSKPGTPPLRIAF